MTPWEAFQIAACRYYTLWKAYSAQQALAGVHALQRSWNVWDAIVLADLRRQLQSMQRNGVVFPSGGWPSRILSLAPRYQYFSALAKSMWLKLES